MTIKTALWAAFLSGLMFASILATTNGFLLPAAKKEPVSVREGSAHGRSHARAGRFFFYRSGK